MPPKTESMPKSIPPMPKLQWYERMNLLNVIFLLFICAVLYSGSTLKGSGRDLDYVANLLNFLQRFFPPDLSKTTLTQIGIALGETLQIAVLATFFAVFISLVLSLGAAQNISPRWTVSLVRMLLNTIRSIPSLIWALLAVVVVGANPLAGVIALTFYSIGYLGKFFSETFESVDIEVARGLRATGADIIQAFQFGIWPHAKPLIWSHSLWMLEYNIRSASIIGYVGAGGIGLQLHTYQEFGDWPKFATILFCILILVTVLDFLGEMIRKKITQVGGKDTSI